MEVDTSSMGHQLFLCLLEFPLCGLLLPSTVQYVVLMGLFVRNDAVPSTRSTEFGVCSWLGQQHFLSQELHFELRRTGTEGGEAL